MQKSAAAQVNRLSSLVSKRAQQSKHDGKEVAVVEDTPIKELDKLEHRIDQSIKNVAANISAIMQSLHEIDKKQLYQFRNCKTIRDYIVKNDYPKRLSLHISSIFMKLQVIDYAEKHQIEYPVIQDIGESKFKVLVQTGAEIGKDISLEDVRNKKFIEIENMLRKKNRKEQPHSTPEGPSLKIKLNDVKRIYVDDDHFGVYFTMNKTTYNAYLELLKDLDNVSFDTQITLKG